MPDDVQRCWAQLLSSFSGGQSKQGVRVGTANGHRSAAPEPDADQAIAKHLQEAVHALLAFMQANFTGPPETETASQSSHTDAAAGGSTSMAASAAEASLSVDGETVKGVVLEPEMLLHAEHLLLKGLGLSMPGESSQAHNAECSVPQPLQPSWRWWAARAVMTHQRILDRPAASLQHLTCTLYSLVHEGLPDAKAHMEAIQPGSGSLAQAALHLEVAMVQQYYRQAAAAQSQLDQAAAVLGVSISVTGAMGMRTVHQLDPKAQLLLAVDTQDQAADSSQASSCRQQDTQGDAESLQRPVTEDLGRLELANGHTDHAQQGWASSWIDRWLFGEASGAAADEIFSAPQFQGDQGETARLDLAQQALVAARAGQVRRQAKADELAPWEAAPYVDAVLSQSHSVPALRATCSLLRARHEGSRSRTKERALLALQQLAGLASAPSPDMPAQARLCWVFAVALPSHSHLRCEAAEALLAAGSVGEAMAEFQALRQWDSLLLCLRLLDKSAQALDLVQRRLQEEPDNAQLLCALGDVTRKPQHYETAWTVSKGRCTRAQRSLAKRAMQQSDWPEAAAHWEKALAINPLNAEGWFALGHCQMKCSSPADAEAPAASQQQPSGDQQDPVSDQQADLEEQDESEEATSSAAPESATVQRALQAFTRTVQQAPDHAQAWNNLAALHMQAGRWEQALWALKEATRLSRDSWQVWSNYSLAAWRTGDWTQAAKGCLQVLQLSQGQVADIPLVQSLVEHVVKAKRAAGTYGQPRPELGVRVGPGHLEAAVAHIVDTSLSVTVPGGPSARAQLLGCQADLCSAAGQSAEARAALTGQVRALASTAWQTHEQAYKQYATAAVRLAQALQASTDAAQVPTVREVASMRLLLRGLSKKGAINFPNIPELGHVSTELHVLDAA